MKNILFIGSILLIVIAYIAFLAGAWSQKREQQRIDALFLCGWRISQSIDLRGCIDLISDGNYAEVLKDYE